MMRNELRHTIRDLAKDRGFTAMVVLSLAVGIGANTAIFSLVNGVLLRPPAYRDPGRLVAAGQIVPKFAKMYPTLPLNLGILMEWRKQAASFDGFGVVHPTTFNLTGVGDPELLPGAVVSANMFTVLGVEPRLGRSFADGEDPDGHDGVVILADSLWRRRFHADPGIVGRKILLNGSPREVVGVLPPSFRFPTGFQLGPYSAVKFEVFKPLGYEPDDLKVRMGDFNYWVIARLRPAISVSTGRAELNVIQAAISQRIPDNLDLHASVQALQEQMVGAGRQPGTACAAVPGGEHGAVDHGRRARSRLGVLGFEGAPGSGAHRSSASRRGPCGSAGPALRLGRLAGRRSDPGSSSGTS